ncbi:hypothetical protein SME06J_35320 [Serratia marcescens]|nr:hypothetical protein SME06J_35320 [Serratia marcescens]
METIKHTLARLHPVAIILASLFTATAAQAQQDNWHGNKGLDNGWEQAIFVGNNNEAKGSNNIIVGSNSKTISSGLRTKNEDGSIRLDGLNVGIGNVVSVEGDRNVALGLGLVHQLRVELSQSGPGG